MNTTKRPALEWTGYADEQEVADYLEHLNDSREEGEKIGMQEGFELIHQDSDYWQMQWESFMECLDEMLAGRLYWRDDANRIGWRSLSGYKIFRAEDAREFLNAITPDTSEFTVSITPYYKGFKIRISHHDAPMGEYHILRPITEEAYEKDNA